MNEEPATILPEELWSRLQKGEPIQVVDVRLSDDFDAERLPQSASNCVFEVAFGERMDGLCGDKDQPVAVYGWDGESLEAKMAAAKLQRAGFGSVYVLSGGFEGWKAAGLPVEGAGGGKPEAAVPGVPEGTREIDPEESRILWTGRNLLNHHRGSIRVKSGSLEFAGGKLTGGELVIDMRSMACDDLAGDPLHDVLIAHLESDDFFDTERFPEARFVITAAAPVPEAGPGLPNVSVEGELTLKDTTRPVNLLAAAGITAEGKAAAQALLTLDRTEWGVLYGSGKLFRRLAGHLVNDLIELQLRIVTR